MNYRFELKPLQQLRVSTEQQQSSQLVLCKTTVALEQAMNQKRACRVIKLYVTVIGQTKTVII